MASFVHSFRYHCTDHIAKEYRILKRQIFSSQPRVGGDILAGFITTYSVYLLSDDPEIFVLYIIYLSYIFILYIYLVLFLFSAVRIRLRFLILQTPVT